MSQAVEAPQSQPLAVILSGGGARGAYEVGVLSYVFGELVRVTGKVPRMDIISGCSVGAVNGTFLASVAHQPVSGMEKLLELWDEIDFSQVLGFGVRELAFLHRVWLGGAKPQGLFDAEPLARLIERNVSWLNLGRNLRRGVLRALTLCTTHVASGRPHVFVDMSARATRPPNVGRQCVMRQGPVRAKHVLASAAIPIVFPMVDIDGELYCDGGLRVNTPTAPAIHLGARKLFVVGLSHNKFDSGTLSIAPDRAPGAPFLFGKVLDAFFLDHLEADIHEIGRINEYMSMGEAVFGPDFIEKINREARARQKPARNPVTVCAVRPSVDLGYIAHGYLTQRSRRVRTDTALVHALIRAIDVGEAAEADLASFLLFDANYVRELVELGRRDAAQKRDELEHFFFAS
ncbi:MAG: patatin-like phospholipase family protein [Myxococcales bacterium]